MRQRIFFGVASTILISGLLQFIGISSAFAATYSFTSAGATGRNGPTQTQINAAYASSNLSGAVTVTATGIQKFTVPVSGQYYFELAGAKGGNSSVTGGGGARFSTNSLNLTQGEILQIGVGQIGVISTDGTGAGGGGASWVYRESTSALIAIAGGGGGGGRSGVTNARSTAQNNSNGNGEGGASSGGQQPNGGTNGNGGINSTNICGLGGAGWLGNGTASASCGRSGTSAAIQIRTTAVGGGPDSGTGAGAVGGFGGGGAGAGNCGYGGGGGGYSGGGGGSYNAGCGGPGGAGGSLSNAGFNWIGTNSAVGYVTVVSLGPSVSSFTPANSITNNSVLTYSLSFTESVSGLTSNDFSITGTGASTCATSITGSGTS